MKRFFHSFFSNWLHWACVPVNYFFSSLAVVTDVSISNEQNCRGRWVEWTWTPTSTALEGSFYVRPYITFWKHSEWELQKSTVWRWRWMCGLFLLLPIELWNLWKCNMLLRRYFEEYESKQQLIVHIISYIVITETNYDFNQFFF